MVQSSKFKVSSSKFKIPGWVGWYTVSRGDTEVPCRHSCSEGQNPYFSPTPMRAVVSISVPN